MVVFRSPLAACNSCMVLVIVVWLRFNECLQFKEVCVCVSVYQLYKLKYILHLDWPYSEHPQVKLDFLFSSFLSWSSAGILVPSCILLFCPSLLYIGDFGIAADLCCHGSSAILLDDTLLWFEAFPSSPTFCLLLISLISLYASPYIAV